MKLTPEQENFVYEYVETKKIGNKLLKNNLIDHLFCVIEIQLEKGSSFNIAFDRALNQLAPNGLEEIEKETIYLLNYNRIIIMKQFMYFVGFLGALALTAGITFKLLSLPFGYELFATGFLILFLIFIPLYSFDRYKITIAKNLSQRIKIILGVIASLITGLAGLFKVLHLQGADLLLMLGAFIFTVGFLPFLFFTMYKKSVS
jgi:uncharacterized membrane protein